MKIIIIPPRQQVRYLQKRRFGDQKTKDFYKLLVVGGGSGGIATASIFSRKLGKGAVGIIEPSKYHYYQPSWTLVGAGMKNFRESQGLTSDYIPRQADWIKDGVSSFDPTHNSVTTLNGRKIGYEYLVVAMGIQLDFDKIPGLSQGLKDPDSGVCCNYSPQTVTKTFGVIKSLNNGNAVFTFPETPVKCAGAAQKIMYLTESYTRKKSENDIKFHYMTPQDSIFMVPKYSKALEKIIQERGINFMPKLRLSAVDNDRREAIFTSTQIKEDVKEAEVIRYPFSMLHVTPPMSAPDILKKSPLSDPMDPYGYMKVDKEYLCSPDFPNVYGIGDCTNVPKSKTLAAITSELKTLHKNLSSTIDGKSPYHKSIGYSSCPLVVSYDKCILAEFDYDKKPTETFPINQAVPRRSMMLLKKYFMPFLYWHVFLKGYWEGPGLLRKIFRLGMT